MSSLRHLGYSNHSAIADLIDNAVDADANTIIVQVDRNEGDFVITVADDGTGMDDAILDEATKLGSDTDRNVASDLGLYGMGLVTASISIGRRFEVLTRVEGGPVLVAVNDLDEVTAEMSSLSTRQKPMRSRRRRSPGRSRRTASPARAGRWSPSRSPME